MHMLHNIIDFKGTTEGGNDGEGANNDGSIITWRNQFVWNNYTDNSSDFYAMARIFQAIEPEDLVSEFSALLPQTEKVI